MSKQVISELAISLPFSFSAYGKVGDTTSTEKIWADKVRSAVGTLINERPMRPRFGSKIPYHMFDNIEETSNKLKSEIVGVFNTLLPQLTLINVVISVNDVDNILSASITYSLPNQATVASTNIGLATLSGNNPINEESR